MVDIVIGQQTLNRVMHGEITIVDAGATSPTGGILLGTDTTLDKDIYLVNITYTWVPIP